MTRLTRLCLAAVVFTALGCSGENILKERPVTRVAKPAATRPTFSAGGSGRSTVCAAYHRQLLAVHSRRVLAPADEGLKRSELSLNAIIADACE